MPLGQLDARFTDGSNSGTLSLRIGLHIGDLGRAVADYATRNTAACAERLDLTCDREMTETLMTERWRDER